MIAIKSSFPVFIVKSILDAKAFYTSHFNFGVVFENEWYLHLVTTSGVQVGFMLPDQPTQPAIFHAQHAGPGVIFSLEVDDADAAYRQAQDKQLAIVLTLRSEAWGQRHFSVQDPNGVYLDVVQAIEPSEEYQVQYTPE